MTLNPLELVTEWLYLIITHRLNSQRRHPDQEKEKNSNGRHHLLIRARLPSLQVEIQRVSRRTM